MVAAIIPVVIGATKETAIMMTGMIGEEESGKEKSMLTAIVNVRLIQIAWMYRISLMKEEIEIISLLITETKLADVMKGLFHNRLFALTKAVGNDRL